MSWHRRTLDLADVSDGVVQPLYQVCQSLSSPTPCVHLADLLHFSCSRVINISTSHFTDEVYSLGLLQSFSSKMLTDQQGNWGYVINEWDKVWAELWELVWYPGVITSRWPKGARDRMDIGTQGAIREVCSVIGKDEERETKHQTHSLLSYQLSRPTSHCPKLEAKWYISWSMF